MYIIFLIGYDGFLFFFFCRKFFKVIEDDIFLGIFLFFYIYGMCLVMMGVLVDGGKLVILLKFDLEMFLKVLDLYKVVISFIKKDIFYNISCIKFILM